MFCLLLATLLFNTLPATEEMTPLEGGYTNAKLYAFDVEGERLVVRYFRQNAEVDERQGQVRAQSIASELGLAPPPLHLDSDCSYFVMPFVEGHPLSQDDLENPIVAARLGEMVATLQGNSDGYPTRRSLRERIALHYQKGRASGVAYPTGFAECVQGVVSRPRSRQLVPSHGDLNPSNILVDGERIVWIDWAGATLDDPLVDLAFLARLSGMSRKQEMTLLSGYFGRAAQDEEWRALQEVKREVDLLGSAIWFRFSESEEEKRLPYEERVARLDAEAASIDPTCDHNPPMNPKTAPKEIVREVALRCFKSCRPAENSL